MKELDFKQMESVQGGSIFSSCACRGDYVPCDVIVGPIGLNLPTIIEIFNPSCPWG